MQEWWYEQKKGRQRKQNTSVNNRYTYFIRSVLVVSDSERNTCVTAKRWGGSEVSVCTPLDTASANKRGPKWTAAQTDWRTDFRPSLPKLLNVSGGWNSGDKAAKNSPAANTEHAGGRWPKKEEGRNFLTIKHKLKSVFRYLPC